jgi:hypothetical protein
MRAAVRYVVEHPFKHRARLRWQAAASGFSTEPDSAGAVPWCCHTGGGRAPVVSRPNGSRATGCAESTIDKPRCPASSLTHSARSSGRRSSAWLLASEGPRPPLQQGVRRVDPRDQARSPIMILGVGGVTAPPGRTVAALRQASTTGRKRKRPAVVRRARDLVSGAPEHACPRAAAASVQPAHPSMIRRFLALMREAAAALLGFGNRLRARAVRRRCGERRCVGSSPGRRARARSACR